MRSSSSVVGRLPALGAALVLALGLTACTEEEKPGGEDGATPEEVLAEAKTILDETSGVEMTLETDELPSGVTGVVSAVGRRRAPAGIRGQLRPQRQRAARHGRGDRRRRHDVREELAAAAGLDRDRPGQLRRPGSGELHGSRDRLLRAALGHH